MDCKVIAEYQRGHVVSERPDDCGGYVGYWDKWAALRDAVRWQWPVCLRVCDGHVTGNLREQPGDVFYLGHYAFTVLDIEVMWLSREVVLSIELASWTELEEIL